MIVGPFDIRIRARVCLCDFRRASLALWRLKWAIRWIRFKRRLKRWLLTIAIIMGLAGFFFAWCAWGQM